MSTTKKRVETVTFAELGSRMDQSLNDADAIRASGLASLKKLRQARGERVQIELERMSARLPEDAPRIVALRRRATTEQEWTRELAHALARAEVQVPESDEGGLTIHGRVISSEGRALPNLKLGLFDDKAQHVELVGFAHTDERGHFELSYQHTTDGKPVLGAGRTQALFVHVFRPDGELLQVVETPVFAELGAVVYREIVVDPAEDSPPTPSPTKKKSKTRAGKSKKKKKKDP